MPIQVLKGGSTPDRDGTDNPWKPLDDFEAPYREPKLPPPGIWNVFEIIYMCILIFEI